MQKDRQINVDVGTDYQGCPAGFLLGITEITVGGSSAGVPVEGDVWPGSNNNAYCSYTLYVYDDEPPLLQTEDSTAWSHNDAAADYQAVAPTDDAIPSGWSCDGLSITVSTDAGLPYFTDDGASTSLIFDMYNLSLIHI